MRKRLSLTQGIGIIEVSIKKSRNSFFSRLSELASTQINLEVAQIPSVSNYIVFAYSYGKDLDKYIVELLSSSVSLRKSKIKRIKYWQDRGLYYILALKSKCEFFKIAEDSQVAILSPYVFNKGIRNYIALGEEKNLENYIYRVKKYYGEYNVSYRYVDTVEHINKLLLRISLLSILFDKLTNNELKVLYLAYRSGYFDYPRRTSLEKLGSNLSLSKVTIDIHLRKAFKKVFEELMRFMEL